MSNKELYRLSGWMVDQLGRTDGINSTVEYLSAVLDGLEDKG